MPTLESMRRRIDSSRDLHGVVKTMKAIAAVSIRRYEEAAAASERYAGTVEAGLRAALHGRRELLSAGREAAPRRLLAVVFGSAQGMCGQFNEDVVDFAASRLAEAAEADVAVAAVGERTAALLDAEGVAVRRRLALPTSVAAVADGVGELLAVIEAWRGESGTGRVLLIHNRKRSGSSYAQRDATLLPLPDGWLRELAGRPWPSRSLPAHRMAHRELLGGLLRQHLFAALYRAFADSLAAESASRLAAMQAAESSIEDHLSDLETRYHRLRQDAITEELLDIAAGYESLRERS